MLILLVTYTTAAGNKTRWSRVFLMIGRQPDMSTEKVGNYIADHWYGRQGFAWSFWVNLVLLRTIVLLMQDFLGPAGDGDYSTQSTIVVSLAILFHGVLFVWQLVGVLRAGEVHIRAMGSMANVWGAQLGALIAFWLTAAAAIGAWQMTLPAPDDENSQARIEAERAAKYSFVPSVDGLTLVFTGSIELGISKQFATQLKRNPKLQTIVLNSPGGNIYEARGLAKLIHENELNTIVIEQCNSSCTIVFIGGIRRELTPNARLGFHQYRIDATYSVLNADASAEQERDRLLYAKAGVKPPFLMKMFESHSDEMWFPEIDDLLDAGVVTGILGSASPG